ncbi:MAG TPA: hypothetical protein VLM37_04935 [Fibrobacteraceae bacterium]|nr:hypothetical protein [Fibrobacteraceae bacterium]
MSNADLVNSVTGDSLNQIEATMLKKAQTADASQVQQLVDQLPKANPAGMGTQVDTTA